MKRIGGLTRPLLAFLALALLFQTGCGPLPRPFQPAGKEATALESLRDGASLLVLPLAGAPPGAPNDAATQLATALRDLDIAASSTPGPAERVLAGLASVTPAADGSEQIRIEWRLSEPGGAPLGGFEQISRLPAGLWASGQAAAVGSVMARAAQETAALLGRAEAADVAANRPAGPPTRTRLVLLPLDDLPGDGGYSLPRALERSLSAGDVDIGWDIENSDLLVMGQLQQEPDGPGWETASFTWWVVKAEDGEDLGQVDQSNRIPAGSLDGSWGPAAAGIAEGAAEGILAIVRRHEENR